MAVKFIDNWMFASRLWNDANMTPIAINLCEVIAINERRCEAFGIYVEITLKNGLEIPIDGDTVEIFAEFQKHLQKYIL